VRIPDDEVSPLDRLLVAQAGVLTWRQATTALGASKVRYLLTRGRWHRVCRGILRAGPEGTGYDREQQWWVAVLAAGEQAVLAGLAAATAGGLAGTWRYAVVDVLVPHAGHAPDLVRRPPAGMPTIRVRRTRALAATDLVPGTPDRTVMPRSLLDAAQWAGSDEQARQFLVSGCRQRLTTPAELTRTLEGLPRARRRPLIRRTLRALTDPPEPLAGTDLTRLCRRYGLPLPQGRAREAAGRIRFLDGYWPQWRLHVEVDGAHLLEARHWVADLRRRNQVWIDGDRTLRFTVFDLRHRPAEVVAQLRTALAAAGWRP
jgi:hypothetical protein